MNEIKKLSMALQQLNDRVIELEDELAKLRHQKSSENKKPTRFCPNCGCIKAKYQIWCDTCHVPMTCNKEFED